VRINAQINAVHAALVGSAMQHDAANAAILTAHGTIAQLTEERDAANETIMQLTEERDVANETNTQLTETIKQLANEHELALVTMAAALSSNMKLQKTIDDMNNNEAMLVPPPLEQQM
jgi:uncharacterized coiled-coil DUF342 family protein